MQSLLQNLFVLSEKQEDLSVIPEDAMKDIKKNIKAGAQDLDQDWANALELAQKAYQTAGVERPTPSERGGWEQYEEMITYAVEQLHKARKLTSSDWRMSSKIFKEAMERKIKIRVYEIGNKFGKGHTVEARNMEEIIEMVRKQAGSKGFEMDVADGEDGGHTCSFSHHGIQRPYKITLKQL